MLSHGFGVCAGANYDQIPVNSAWNCPRHDYNARLVVGRGARRFSLSGSMQTHLCVCVCVCVCLCRDGPMCVNGNKGGSPNYEPNSVYGQLRDTHAGRGRGRGRRLHAHTTHTRVRVCVCMCRHPGSGQEFRHVEPGHQRRCGQTPSGTPHTHTRHTRHTHTHTHAQSPVCLSMCVCVCVSVFIVCRCTPTATSSRLGTSIAKSATHHTHTHTHTQRERERQGERESIVVCSRVCVQVMTREDRDHLIDNIVSHLKNAKREVHTHTERERGRERALMCVCVCRSRSVR